MNSRRDFLKRIGIGIGTFMVAPQLLKGIDISENTEPTIKKEYTVGKKFIGVDEEEEKFTEGFFNYLKNNNVGFTWERTKHPVFATESGKSYQVVARQLYTKYNENWKEGFVESNYVSLSAGTTSYHQYETEEEYHNMLYARIANEILRMKPERIYIYSLRYMPVVYNPYNFEVQRNIILRSVNIVL